MANPLIFNGLNHQFSYCYRKHRRHPTFHHCSYQFYEYRLKHLELLNYSITYHLSLVGILKGLGTFLAVMQLEQLLCFKLAVYVQRLYFHHLIHRPSHQNIHQDQTRRPYVSSSLSLLSLYFSMLHPILNLLVLCLVFYLLYHVLVELI